MLRSRRPPLRAGASSRMLDGSQPSALYAPPGPSLTEVGLPPGCPMATKMFLVVPAGGALRRGASGRYPMAAICMLWQPFASLPSSPCGGASRGGAAQLLGRRTSRAAECTMRPPSLPPAAKSARLGSPTATGPRRTTVAGRNAAARRAASGCSRLTSTSRSLRTRGCALARSALSAAAGM